MTDGFKLARLCQGGRLYDEAYDGNNAPDWAVKYMEFLYESHHRPRHIFPFMLLPAELREIVYRFALTRDGPMHVRGKKTMIHQAEVPGGGTEWMVHEPQKYPSFRERNLDLHVADIKLYNNEGLATGCLYMDRQTSAEAAHVLYAKGIFRFDDKDILDEFLARLPASSIARIRNIQFMVSFDPSNGDYLPLFDLPGDLRSLVYAHALTNDQPIRLTTRMRIHGGTEHAPKMHQGPQLGLLYANKTVYAEARPILYQWNIFRFSGTLTLHLLMQTLPDGLAPHLRNLIVVVVPATAIKQRS
ncbi:hypothetical protein SLS55_006829 [Diplodia seriata]|uniref:DUF7730 domain-containing protein n=1 Tax=Diplodia seriata TaxID=420778 RepID=A0ABR3CAJ2_9PEZI